MKFDDLSIIKNQLLQGDNSCLEIIFKKHSDFCIKNLKSTTGCSSEDAEDIFIESVMNFRERVISGQLENIGNVRNYIYTTCRNMWANRVRKTISQEKRKDDISDFLYEELAEDPFIKVENALEEERLIGISKEAFGQLSKQCQSILHYFYIEDRKMADIADVMQLANPNVAKVMKFRCLNKLTTIAQGLFKTVNNGGR